jgi:hypothetical protein
MSYALDAAGSAASVAPDAGTSEVAAHTSIALFGQFRQSTAKQARQASIWRTFRQKKLRYFNN